MVKCRCISRYLSSGFYPLIPAPLFSSSKWCLRLKSLSSEDQKNSIWKWGYLQYDITQILTFWFVFFMQIVLVFKSEWVFVQERKKSLTSIMSENRRLSTLKIRPLSFFFFSHTLKFLWICENFLKRHLKLMSGIFFHFIVFSFLGLK